MENERKEREEGEKELRLLLQEKDEKHETAKEQTTAQLQAQIERLNNRLKEEGKRYEKEVERLRGDNEISLAKEREILILKREEAEKKQKENIQQTMKKEHEQEMSQLKAQWELERARERKKDEEEGEKSYDARVKHQQQLQEQMATLERYSITNTDNMYGSFNYDVLNPLFPLLLYTSESFQYT